MKSSNQDLMSLKKRFVDDLKFPITVFEDGYWEFYLELYEKEFHVKTLWEKLLEDIEGEYEGNIQSFLSDFYKNQMTQYFAIPFFFVLFCGQLLFCC